MRLSQIALILFALTAATPVSATQSVQPVRCDLRIVVVDVEGGAIEARVDVLDADVRVQPLGGGARCIQLETERADLRLLVSAEGYQPHATEAIEVRRHASSDMVVTLVRPFAEVVDVQGRSTSLVGVAESASAGVVGAADLAARPLIRAGDLIEAVPGVAMTQHSSGGHAPIILLRGYNLDHGTDFGTSFEGAPLNLPSHAHAQGYTDTNFLIEDVVARIEFLKGPYSARTGNFSTAGAANIELADRIDRPILRVEGGGNSFGRVMTAVSFGPAERGLLLAAEGSHDDGPSDVPDDFKRVKGIARYSSATATRHLAITVASYAASWFATDGYPQRALDRGYLGRFGTLDASDGGRTQQHLLVAAVRRPGSRGLLDAGAFARYYDLDLFSNLTFWTASPEHGDQIWQADRRGSFGGHLTYSRIPRPGTGRVELTAGVQLRHDLAGVRLRNTRERTPVVKRSASGAAIPATVYDNRIAESSVAPFVEVRVRARSWLRAQAGLRLDATRMRVTSDRVENSGTRIAAVASPKGSLVFGPWRGLEAYVNGGLGFHSNHAAGVMQRVDPTEGTSVRADGTSVNAAPPLVRTTGAETGIRVAAADRVQSSVALWLLDSGSELVYTAEDGVTAPERPGRRFGVEWLNVVKVSRALAVDLDAAWSSARYRTDPLGQGRLIPDAAQAVVGGGVTMSTARVGATLRARYVGRRPLLPSGQTFVGESLVLNGQAELRISSRVRLTVQAFNLLNRRYEDTAYYFSTRLRDPRTGVLESHAVGDFVTHPGQPRTARAGLRIAL